MPVLLPALELAQVLDMVRLLCVHLERQLSSELWPKVLLTPRHIQGQLLVVYLLPLRLPKCGVSWGYRQRDAGKLQVGCGRVHVLHHVLAAIRRGRRRRCASRG